MSDPECQNNCVRDSLEDQGKLQEADSIATRSDGKVEFRKWKKGIVDRRKNLSEKVKVGTCWLWHGEARTSVRRMRRHYCRSKGLRDEARFGRKGEFGFRHAEAEVRQAGYTNKNATMAVGTGSRAPLERDQEWMARLPDR